MQNGKLIGALLALPFAVPAVQGCDVVLEPEGVKVKADADGVLTEDERESAKHLLSSPEKVLDFSPAWQGLVNDADVFFAEEFEAAGMQSHRFDDELHLYMAEDMETLESRIVKPRGNYVPRAFHLNSNSTIYILKDNFLPAAYFSVVFHEAGHHLRVHSYETPSLAYETYAALRAYSLDRQVGSLVAGGAVRQRQKCLHINEYFVDDFIKYYEIGYLGFLSQAIRSGGNLELAVDKIQSAPRLYLEAIAVEAGSGYANVCEANFYELEKLLGMPGFIAGMRRHMTMEEASEYTDYLLLKARDVMMQGLEQSGIVSEGGAVESFMADAEGFIALHGHNPFFRADAASALTEDYFNHTAMPLAYAASASGNSQDKMAAYESFEKIISLNIGYPCRFEPFECPLPVSEPRMEHTFAYLYALDFGKRLASPYNGSYSSLLALPEEYIAKFCPGGRYHYEDNHFNAAVATPYITYMAAGMEMQMAYAAYAGGDSEAGRLRTCSAIGWYKIVLEAGCSRVPDEEKKAECEAHIGGGLERNSESMINRYILFYQRNCMNSGAGGEQKKRSEAGRQ